MAAAQLKEVPMTKAKSRHKLVSRVNDSKTKTRNSVRRTTARKAIQVTEPAAHQQPQPASQSTTRTVAGRRDRASARSRSPRLAGALEEHVPATAALSSARASAVCRSR